MPGLSGYKGTDKPKRAFYKSDEAYEKDLKRWRTREAKKKKKASGSAGDVASPNKKTDRIRKAMKSQKKY